MIPIVGFITPINRPPTALFHARTTSFDFTFAQG
jgi:hypothetical protein